MEKGKEREIKNDGDDGSGMMGIKMIAHVPCQGIHYTFEEVLENKVVAVEFVRKSIANSIATVFKSKEKFLAAKEAHVTQVKHLQELKEEISNLEAELSELRNQVPLAEQTKKSLAEQRNKLRADMEVGLKSAAKIKDQLPSFTASTDEAAEEIKNMRE
ncbi:hypothetical protein SLEP1_g50446 [Rubroshorea leprosula]|uniref:Uncharacterized protein n=1 Tax=Rubroshorea leprosula TaxID=152421 RepID=A0AAV5M0Y1_9ROSI|nr:hypothetical protein SLEP1_g50446 [Rubroshorea leprosula]